MDPLSRSVSHVPASHLGDRWRKPEERLGTTTYAEQVWQALAREGYRYSAPGWMSKGPFDLPVPPGEREDAKRASDEAARGAEGE